MVATCKGESKNEEIGDKVRARATVTTDPGEGIAELGQQIVKLMAALNKAGQGSNPSSVQVSPRREAMGGDANGSCTLSHPNSNNGRSGPGQTTPAHSLPTGCGAGANGTVNNGQNNQRSSKRRVGTMDRQDPNSLQCFRCQGWGHMTRQWNALPQCQLSISPRRTEGMWLTPCWQKPPQPTVGPVHSHPNPGPRPASIRAAQ